MESAKLNEEHYYQVLSKSIDVYNEFVDDYFKNIVILYLLIIFHFFYVKQADLKDFYEIESMKSLEMVKDSVMKLLVYEISIARGIQYDIDRMSKV